MTGDEPSWLAAILNAPATGYISTGGLLAVAITLILTGRLVPGKERDYWRDAYFKSQETKAELVKQNSALLNFAPLLDHFFTSVIPKKGRTLNGGHDDEPSGGS